MKQLSHVVPASLGKSAATDSSKPSDNSEKASTPLSEHAIAAARWVSDLYGKCALPDVEDPVAFLRTVSEVVAKYPAEAWTAAEQIVIERHTRPWIADITAALEEAYEPIAWRLRRDRLDAESRRMIAERPRKRTPEEQARIDAQVEDYFRSTGRPAPNG